MMFKDLYIYTAFPHFAPIPRGKSAKLCSHSTWDAGAPMTDRIRLAAANVSCAKLDSTFRRRVRSQGGRMADASVCRVLLLQQCSMDHDE